MATFPRARRARRLAVARGRALASLALATEPPSEALAKAGEKAKRAAAACDEPLVSFDEFTLAVRGPPMGTSRVQITRAAYSALKDDARSGIKTAVKPWHLAERLDVSKHPALAAGALDEEGCAMAFLKVWCADRERLDTEVDLKEFCDRFEWISPLYDDDKDFDAMMRAAWRLK